MAGGPAWVLRPRDDALADAVARDAVPRDSEREGVVGRSHSQGGLGQSWITIWGKGKGGLSKQRSLPLRVEVAEKLRGYLQWRQDHGIVSEHLFVTTWGLPWSESSWGFNKTIRTLCLPRFNRWAQSQGTLDVLFSQEEVRKMTTHKMGRHVFATVYAPQLPAKTLMEYMGITN